MVVFAPAKLTLSLRITGVRKDGYHFIDAEMTTLDFGDRLEIIPGGSGVEMEMTYESSVHKKSVDVNKNSDDTGVNTTEAVVGIAGTGVSTAGPVVNMADNLVVKALELVNRKARVKVRKNIPLGGGLGGGSSDAAAVLRWAGFRDVQQAASIGADVAFCLVGGRARVRGVGECVESMSFVHEQFTLLTPPVFCPTPDVYAAWDRLGGPTGPNGNDLEPAALHVLPELAFWRDELGNATGLTPRLAGSGSTWFVPGAHPGLGYIATTTCPRLC